MEHIPVRYCCMKLCETQLIAEEDYKFARTHTFALLTMVIALTFVYNQASMNMDLLN